MSSEWSTGKLGEFIELKRGYDLPKAKRKLGTIPLVSSSGISDTHEVAMVKGPGVVTGRYGTIGEVFYVDTDFWPLNTTLYVRDFKGNDRKYINYFLKTLDFHAYSDKAAVPGINRNHLHEAVVTLPPIGEQKEIAKVLGALDDRITLLRETNKTLESIAQAIFKSWFVDFDPVRAKIEGLQPEGMDEETAALFPDSFESDSGGVPRDWHSGKLGDVATASRSSVSVSGFSDAVAYVGLEHMPRRELGLTSWGTAAGLESTKTAFLANDILFGKLRPYFHKVVIAPLPGVCSTDILACRSKAALFHAFVALHLFSDTLVTYADRLSNGAKMPRVSWKDLAAYPVTVPPEPVAARFNLLIQPIFEKMQSNVFQAQTLTGLRDSLLPRLISGQIRLPEA